MRSGKSVSSAIAIAVSRIKVWASGKGVDADTQAKASAALAQWEKLKSKSSGKTKLSIVDNDDNILNLSAFKMDDVSSAYQTHWGAKRAEWRKNNTSTPYLEDITNPYSYRYVKEVWSSYLIVSGEYPEKGLFKVPFKANKDGTFTFSDDIPVKQSYVAIKDAVELSAGMPDAELIKLSVVPCSEKEFGSLAEMVALSQRMPNKPLTERLGSFGIVI